MRDESWTFLRTLIETPGPSGYEREVAAVWRAEAESVADEVDRDLTGNSFASLDAVISILCSECSGNESVAFVPGRSAPDCSWVLPSRLCLTLRVAGQKPSPPLRSR